MKSVGSSLQNLLNASRRMQDAQLAFADCFTFTLTTGAILTFTNADVPVSYRGALFRADGPLVQGLKYRSTVGLNVDRQDIVIAARPSDLTSANGAPVLTALANGAFEGCTLRRDRVFFSDYVGGGLVDGVCLFQGRISTIDQVGRTQARLSVATDLTYLDIDMPRNIYQPTCLHTLYDAGCGLFREAFAVQGAVGAGSTTSVINFSGAFPGLVQGALICSSGINAGQRATVKWVAPGFSLTLVYPLRAQPSPGDNFTVYQGCDHTQQTCRWKFNNLGNFRGFPAVPAPQYAV